MSTTFITKLIAASLIATPVAASASGSQPAANETAKAAPAAEKKICKQLPSSTSRLPERVCLTEKEWKQVDNGQ
jgi:hypothetical protein